MRIARGEILGPVAMAIPFKNEEDAVLQGNDTVYDLAASVWTHDVSRTPRLARALKAGTVLINCHGGSDVISPFGGYKQSGFGRELGENSLELYIQIKSVYCKL
jgi:acyl-CoA reductase-like NAD-dependent aldehyde dehydrogenase